MFSNFFLPRPSDRRHYRVMPLVTRFLLAVASLPAAGLIALTLGFGVPRSLLVAAAVYLIVGILLSRAIEKRLRWNTNFTTLATAARAKLAFILAWPVATPLLVWRMLVVKFL